MGVQGQKKSSSPALALAVLVDSYPALTETFIRQEVLALDRQGHRVRVEARTRVAGSGVQAPRACFREDDRTTRRLADLLWLLVRHPLGCARDLLDRRRWRREEHPATLRELAPAARRIVSAGDHHLHAHFAAGAALDAQRLGAILGLPHSVTAHAYDIFLHPRNLREKLERARFVTSGCDYTVAHLRSLLSPAAAQRVHRVVMGVDAARFTRRRPLPRGRTVVAIGRLVEKKGFAYLIHATALLGDRAPVQRVVIVGEGPLEAALREQARALGVDGTVILSGPRLPDGVRDLLEEADILVMPSIVGGDGDRDSMPVVVKEALAMEVLVVASDAVGLAEVVHDGWGRLVPPADPRALASAIEGLLALPHERRAEMGAAGRAFVLAHANVDKEAVRLAALILAAGR